MTIYEVAPMLILLLFGMIFALIVLGIENLVFRLMHSKQTDVVPLKKDNPLPKGKKVPSKKTVNLIVPKKKTTLKNALITK